MKTSILVLGASGNVGTELVNNLKVAGIPFRVGAFNPPAPEEAIGSDIEIVHFDFLKPETYRQTFEGIDAMFLVRPPALANVERDIAPAINAAVENGVKRIVFLSIQGVEKNHLVPHYKIEQLILETGVEFTFLRCGFFMQNLSTTHVNDVKYRNEIPLPVGNARTAFIDVRDIAAVAAKALTEEKHANQIYTLTGTEALNYNEVAEILSLVLNRTIRYTNPLIPAFIFHQLRQGQRLGYTLVVTALYTITRFGNAETVTDDVARILGRKPILFSQFAQDYREVWM